MLRIIEGNFKNGKKNGYCRTIHAINGHCETGFYKDDEVNGKYSEMCLLDGKVWSEPGIYNGREKIKDLAITDYRGNTAPKIEPKKTITRKEFKKEYELPQSDWASGKKALKDLSG